MMLLVRWTGGLVCVTVNWIFDRCKIFRLDNTNNGGGVSGEGDSKGMMLLVRWLDGLRCVIVK